MATTISRRFLKRCRMSPTSNYTIALSTPLLATGYVPYPSSLLTGSDNPYQPRNKQPYRGAKSVASELRGGDLIEYGEPGNVWRVMDQHFVRQAMGKYR